MIKVRIQLTYRLIPYEIEIEASDQTDITYVLGEALLAKLIDAIQDFTALLLQTKIYLFWENS